MIVNSKCPEEKKIRLHIGEGREINIEIPSSQMRADAVYTTESTLEGSHSVSSSGTTDDEMNVKNEMQVVAELTRKHYRITEVKRGLETKFEGNTLYIREGIEQEAADSQELVLLMDEILIVTPDNYHTYIDTIMDVQPIAVKEEAEMDLGAGVTKILDGVVTVVTGVTEAGVQIGEFGSSEGYINENVMFGRPGAMDEGEILIITRAVIPQNKNMERPGPIAVHCATDYIIQEIREAMRHDLDDSLISETEVLQEVRRPGKRKVAICKEIMGQGAMHDNFLFPNEPVGVLGAKPNVDLGNVPVVASPLEVLDGCVHALTCIGPSTKEMSRHYWREPLVLEALHDEDLDVVGVVFVGSPQANTDKFYVSKRLGQIVASMGVDGAFVSTEGFGNNHVDFTSHIEQIGKKGIPVVGFSFCGDQGQLVTGNKYCDAIVDNNKCERAIENGVLANSTLCREDAIRGIEMLKAKMDGKVIKAPERHFNFNVKQNNIEIIEKLRGEKIDLVDNESVLPPSQNRISKYGE